MTPLSDLDRAFLARHAPAALARRDAAYFMRQRFVWGDWIITGSVGLVGLYVLDWPAITAALVLVAGFWLGWFGDVVFWLARGRALAAAMREAADDEYTWALVSVLRGERANAAGQGRGGPPMGVAIVVDLVAGGAATALMWRGFDAAGVDIAATLRSSAFVTGAAILFVTGVVPLLASRLSARADALEPPVFRVGQRGIGLLVLVFALMAAGGGTLAPKAMMTAAFAFLLVMGALQWFVDIPRQRRDTAWLGDNMETGVVASEIVDDTDEAPTQHPPR